VAMVKTLLFNRYCITFGIFAVIALFWNIYITFHDDGIVAGRVVTADNRPVAGATVTLFEKTLFVAEPRMNTTTNEKGEFSFSGHRYYRIWIEAKKEGVGLFPKTEYRLYFRGQNKRFKEAFRLAEET